MGETPNERVAREVLWAVANGVVVDHLAQRVGAAGVLLARVLAPLVHACCDQRAVRVGAALRPAVGRRAEVPLEAAAVGVAVGVLAGGVGAAGARHARVGGLGLRRLGGYKHATYVKLD